MSSRIRFLLPLAGLWLASPVFASDLAYVKCAVNQDRVWVYESLSSFDVEARLKCGEPVEILHRVKGYVKIRTESGVEGYVPDSVFPDLPALPDDADKPAAASAAQRSVAAAAAKPAAVAVAPAPPAATPPQSVAISITPVAAPQPAAAPAAAVSAVQPSAAKTPKSVKSTPRASAPGHATVQTTASTTAAHTKPAPTVAKKVTPAPSTSSPAFDSAPAARIVHSAPNSPATPSAPARASVETVSARKDSAAVLAANAQPAATVAESEDYPDTQVQNESADPACRVYFAAYGLSPSQYKWMAENRRKEFSGICPAPDLAHVDYVVLFTHDSDSYTYAMPQPVHTDHNGFSDFSPLTTVDTALVKASDVEKARYEFVWVFRMTRGAFDPAKFSPRRRPQFTTYVKGSRAPSRAAEDAFSFVETQGVNR
jgi:hypothetical protein